MQARAEGLDNNGVAARKRVAAHIGTCAATVGTRRRFVGRRPEGLADQRRHAPPRVISDDDVERVVAPTLVTMPKANTRRCTRGMASSAEVPQSSVGRIWRAFGLKPHRAESFKWWTAPYVVDKVRDIVGLSMSPPERALVLCIDEKSQVQAPIRPRPLLPMTPVKGERPIHDYVRIGSTSLFAALVVATGEVFARCHRRSRHHDFIEFLGESDCKLVREPGAEIHPVMDNYGTHKMAAVKQCPLRHPEYHLQFTPSSGSRLNLVERYFGENTERRIRRRAFRIVAALRAAIPEYLEHRNVSRAVPPDRQGRLDPRSRQPPDRQGRPDPRPRQESHRANF